MTELSKNVLDEAEASPVVLDNALGPSPNFIEERILKELKHSVRTHLVMMNGPTQQLTTFLIKVVDFLEDSNIQRRNTEALNLSYSIIEGVALYVQRSIDERSDKAKAMGQTFPVGINLASDNILVLIGKSRNLDDRIAAKSAVLRVVAEALRELSTFTRAVYPDIFDSNGNIL